MRKLAEAYREEARNAGHNLNLGERIGVVHTVYLADSKERARALAKAGVGQG